MNITITMDASRVSSIAQLKKLTNALEPVDLNTATISERYRWIEDVARKFRYASSSLSKNAKREIISSCVKMTGLSRIQVKRLLREYRRNGHIVRKQSRRHKFPRVYTTDDVALLLKADNAVLRRSGPAMTHTFKRMYERYNKEMYMRLARISVSHLYNLRDTRQYQSHAMTISGTKSVAVPIGRREKPKTGGKPGFMRVDTVHQGDMGKLKGVYFINLVDEVTQWEVVACVPNISEMFLEPVLEACLKLFPFRILGFHSDNGSEYINRVVARLLGKLIIDQTKSRARRTNDNALVEGKNGTVIRKHFGHGYIPKKYASAINRYLRDWLVVYLNFHRPCAYATDYIDSKGKIRKKYETHMTPFEKLASLPNASQYLKPGVTLEELRCIEEEYDDITFAELKEKERSKMFKSLS
jgi:transposase InsO family protein